MGDIKESIKEVVSDLSCCLKTYMSNGVGNADTNEVKETADAIRDLCEAMYYCVVTEAMEKGEEYPYGYSQPHYPGGTAGRMTSNSNMGYHDDHMYKPMVDQEPYIRDYIDWKDAKRHYTETHSMNDKDKMDDSMAKHFNNLVTTMKEMYRDADISKKKEMKEDIMAMMNGM